MTDYTKKQPCGECGKMVEPREEHTYNNCLKYKQELKDKRLLELAKKYGNNYTYGQIVKSIKEDIIKPIFEDIERNLKLVNEFTEYSKIKERHLSTFQKKK